MSDGHDERTCPSCRRVIEETGGRYLASPAQPGTDARPCGCIHKGPCRESECGHHQWQDQRTASPAQPGTDAVDRDSFVAGARAVYGKLAQPGTDSVEYRRGWEAGHRSGIEDAARLATIPEGTPDA